MYKGGSAPLPLYGYEHVARSRFTIFICPVNELLVVSIWFFELLLRKKKSIHLSQG